MLTAIERRRQAIWRARIEADLKDFQDRYAKAYTTIQLLQLSSTLTDHQVDTLNRAEEDLDWFEQQIAECAFKLACPAELTRILWDRDRLADLVSLPSHSNSTVLDQGGASWSS